MQVVTAFQDDGGRLHKTKRDAIEADFIMKMQEVWDSLPNCRDRGDPDVIARCLFSSTYPMAKAKLLEALLWLEENASND